MLCGTLPVLVQVHVTVPPAATVSTAGLLDALWPALEEDVADGHSRRKRGRAATIAAAVTTVVLTPGPTTAGSTTSSTTTGRGTSGRGCPSMRQSSPRRQP